MHELNTLRKVVPACCTGIFKGQRQILPWLNILCIQSCPDKINSSFSMWYQNRIHFVIFFCSNKMWVGSCDVRKEETSIYYSCLCPLHCIHVNRVVSWAWLSYVLLHRKKKEHKSPESHRVWWKGAEWCCFSLPLSL